MNTERTVLLSSRGRKEVGAAICFSCGYLVEVNAPTLTEVTHVKRFLFGALIAGVRERASLEGLCSANASPLTWWRSGASPHHYSAPPLSRPLRPPPPRRLRLDSTCSIAVTLTPTSQVLPNTENHGQVQRNMKNNKKNLPTLKITP